MLNSKPLDKLIFLDIETIPQEASFFDMTPRCQELFLKRFKKESEEILGLPMDLWDLEKLKEQEGIPAKLELLYNNRAPICPEFLKVVVISIGWFTGPFPAELKDLPKDQELPFKTKCFAGHDEAKLLSEFYASMKSVLDKTINPTHHLVAYNGIMFDFPVLAKRFIINGRHLPAMLDIETKKEWNLPFYVDPKLSWRMTSFDGGVSLDLLCEVLGVSSSKENLSGDKVRDCYYIDKDLKKIGDYCNLDVSQLATCYLRMKGIPNSITIV